MGKHARVGVGHGQRRIVETARAGVATYALLAAGLAGDFRRFQKRMDNLARHIQQANSLRLHRIAIGNSADQNAPFPRARSVEVLELYDGVDAEDVRSYLKQVRERMSAN